MATRIICCYGGELECENKQWTYTSGSTKTISLDVDTTYEELLSRMYRIIKSTQIDCDIKMKVLYPCSNKSIPPTVLEDDDDVREFLVTRLEHSKKFIPLVIEIIQRINMTTHVDNVAEEHGLEFEYKSNPVQVGGTNDQLPEPSQTSKLLSSQVSGARDLDLIYDYMSPPLATTTNLPLSSTTRRYIKLESDILHPNLPETSNFLTRQVPMPFDDAAFTNAAMLEYTDSLCESIDIAVGQTFKDKSRCQYVLSQFAIQNKFQYKVLYSNSRRFMVVSFEDRCEWSVHASRVSDSGIFKMRTYMSKHTCGMSWMRNDHRQTSSKLACDLVVSRIKQRLG